MEFIPVGKRLPGRGNAYLGNHPVDRRFPIPCRDNSASSNRHAITRYTYAQHNTFAFPEA